MSITAIRLLTIPEVARLLRLTKYSVYRRISAGELHATKLGQHGSLRISEEELARYLEEAEHRA
jgi:excisionase family DNA binding protein